MRPYVAIIKDSFREALASRVLWVLLLMITVLMIALIPFHWRSTIAADMTKLDVRNVGNLATLLKSGGDEEAAPLIRHVWDSFVRVDSQANSRTQELPGSTKLHRARQAGWTISTKSSRRKTSSTRPFGKRQPYPNARRSYCSRVISLALSENSSTALRSRQPCPAS